MMDEKIVELTTFTRDSIPHSAWTEGVLYKGQNVYDVVYNKGFADHAHNKMLENNGDIEDMQECYLGYSPATDMFFLGFNGWLQIPDDADEWDEDYSSDTVSPFVAFKIIDGLPCIQEFRMFDEIWYARGGGMDRLSKAFKDIIHIRLD